MTWRGREEALQLRTPQEFAEYLRGLNYSSWRPSGMVLHNTASPTLDQWWHSGTPPEQRMENLKDYYQYDMGWSAGPHAFVDGVSIWVMTDFNVQGVHSPSWNGTRLGIEMVGDYDTESDESGMGAKVMELTVALFGECHKHFGWEPSNTSIKLHKEDPATDHDCPGRNIVKQEFIEDVAQYMGDGGDHVPPDVPPTPHTGTVYGLVAGDKLNIRATASSSAPVIGQADNGDIVTVIGDAYNGSTRWLRLQFGTSEGTAVEVDGWASAQYIRLDADEEPDEEAIWHHEITATVFGMEGDEQEGSYGDWIDDETEGVSFPYKWRNGPRPRVVVKGPRGETTTDVVDVGPWNTNDPNYVLGTRRPMAEKQYELGLVAQNGQVPSNPAGIDLTEPIAEAVGISGKGKVSWRFAT